MSQQVDRWLLRAKDIIIILAAVLSFAGYGFKLYTLPGIQEAQAKAILSQSDELAIHEKKIAVLESGITDIKNLILGGKLNGSR